MGISSLAKTKAEALTRHRPDVSLVESSLRLLKLAELLPPVLRHAEMNE
jgi:hypothetical protein